MEQRAKPTRREVARPVSDLARDHKNGAKPMPYESIRMLECRTDETETAFVLDLVGEVDLANVSELEYALRSALASGRDVVADLRGLRYMDSTGMHVFFLYRNLAADRGQYLVVTLPAATIRKVLDATGFSEMVPIVPSVEAALELLRTQRS